MFIVLLVIAIIVLIHNSTKPAENNLGITLNIINVNIPQMIDGQWTNPTIAFNYTTNAVNSAGVRVPTFYAILPQGDVELIEKKNSDFGTYYSQPIQIMDTISRNTTYTFLVKVYDYPSEKFSREISVPVTFA